MTTIQIYNSYRIGRKQGLWESFITYVLRYMHRLNSWLSLKPSVKASIYLKIILHVGAPGLSLLNVHCTFKKQLINSTTFG